MLKKFTALLAAVSMAFSMAGCSSDKASSASVESSSSSSADSESSSDASDSSGESSQEESETEPTEAPTTLHVSPVENISSTLGTQINPDKTIQREDGQNTCQLPLSDFIEEGDSISSFTFIIYSGDGKNIGTFKGGCGISVTSDCAAATDEGWYQSADFSSSTQGTYAEIKWDVPAEIRDYISSGGEIMFGYWWGNATSIRLESVVCTYTRNSQIPADGTESFNVGKSVSYSADENTISVPLADVLDAGQAPSAVTFNISSGGSFRKFTGAFGVSSSAGYYQSEDIAVFTDSSSLSLTWILPDEAVDYASVSGSELVLGYWWSEQQSVTLDSVTVKYFLGGETDSSTPAVPDNNSSSPDETSKPVQNEDSSAENSDFRSASEISSAIKVGWNLGNTFDSYDYKEWTTDGETAWGNPRTTQAMISSVKDAGFNAIRIPVTWGEHMDGDTIDSKWMSRVREVVDYAYNEGMFVILNMHHDDYIWFTPSDSEYASDSARLCRIWEQISAEFKDYGDRLLFEGMNEPRTVGSSAEWNGGTAAERAVINKYEQDFVNTVRASGGNNAHRTLIITSYAASAVDAAINDVVVPDDKNIIVSIHYYAPWNFADGTSTQFGDKEKSELSNGFAKFRSTFIDKGTPVIIGEFGCVAEASESVRAQYLEYYVSEAKKNGIKCFLWDNGVSSGESSFGIFDRTKLEWNSSLLSGLMKGAE